jgi:hypothetical protein
LLFGFADALTERRVSRFRICGSVGRIGIPARHEAESAFHPDSSGQVPRVTLPGPQIRENNDLLEAPKHISHVWVIDLPGFPLGARFLLLALSLRI